MVIGVAVGFLVLSLLVMAVWFARKQKRKRAGSHIGYTMPSPIASSQNSGFVLIIAQTFLHYGLVVVCTLNLQS